ncbi:MAG: sigma-70 family RNA polymerase sigma factor [Bacteroidota bacterium]|nr:sigma-70 family RNA polymerase sigma factor [Bacteroidota bacterium]
MTRTLLLSNKLNDEILVSYIQNGNMQAENLLYIRYYDTLLAYNRYLIRDRHKAEDNLQDSIIIAIEKIRDGAYTEQGQLLAYLKKICKFAWLNKNKKKKIIVNIDPEYYEIFPDIDDVFNDEPMHKCVVSAFDEISEQCKLVLEAYFYRNLGMKKILEECPFLKTLENARRRKYRCKEQLKEIAIEYYNNNQN